MGLNTREIKLGKNQGEKSNKNRSKVRDLYLMINSLSVVAKSLIPLNLSFNHLAFVFIRLLVINKRQVEQYECVEI